LGGGSAGAVPYQTGSGATSFATGTGVFVGGSTPSFTTTPTFVGTNISGTASALSIGGNAATATTSTNLAGGSAYAIPYQTGSGTTSFVSSGTSGQLFQTLGSGSAPQWVSQSSLSVGSASNIVGGAAGQIPYQTAIGATSFTAAGTTGQLLQSNGTSAPTWVNANSLSVASATNLLGGATGSLPYQSATNATTFLGIGSNGQVLGISGGALTWTTPTAYATVTDDTTTNATRYPLFANQTSGNLSTEYTSSTNLKYNPSTGSFSALQFAVGTLNYTPANALAYLQNSVSTYNQFIIQNTNTGATASSDVIVNNNLSTDSIYYGDFGMNSSNFSGSGSFNAPNMVYLTATTADLAIGTTTGNAVHFVTSGTTTDNATIASTGIWTFNNAINLATGTTTLAPLTFTSGTNLTTPVQGAHEFDGASLYITGNTSTGSGRQIINASQVTQLATSASVASGEQFFTSTVRPELISGHLYKFQYKLIFTKSTAGTVTVSFSNSATSNFTVFDANMQLIQINNGTTANYNAYAAAATTATFQASFSLLDATTYVANIEGDIIPSANMRLQLLVTDSAGTVTSLLGSNFVFTDFGTTNIGNIG
jgi:hypothetical protein